MSIKPFGTKEILTGLETGGASVLYDAEGVRGRIIDALRSLNQKETVDSNVIQLFENNKTDEMNEVLDEVIEYEVKKNNGKPMSVGDFQSLMSKHQSLFGEKKFTSAPSITPFMKPPSM